MSSLEFTKMSGCGNDFILIDNRKGLITNKDKSELARLVCRRRLSLGADGMIFVEKSRKLDAKMDFYNADGSRGEMCGNGLRCFARYTAEAEICPRDMLVETDAGQYGARLVMEDQVQIDMPPVGLPEAVEAPNLPPLDFITVGVPHVVIFDQDSWGWTEQELEQRGRTVRNNPYFPRGTNVNFVSQTENGIQVRTYERGVEAETLACGTGATASALAASLRFPLYSPAMVHTRGGILLVGFEKHNHGFVDLWLQGSAKFIARGKICPDAL